jgi:hypothetical protein
MIEAARTSETLVYFNETAGGCIPEVRREKLKSQTQLACLSVFLFLNTRQHELTIKVLLN